MTSSGILGSVQQQVYSRDVDVLYHGVIEETPVAQFARPQLHGYDSEDEEDEETEHQHIAQHRQSVQ